jgi:hypothetical protein
MRTSLKRLALGAAIPLISGGALLAMSAPSSAAGPSATVTPSTNISPGEKVTVSGSGFPAGAIIAILECSPRALTVPSAQQQNECDLTGLQTPTADSHGNVPATVYTIPNPFAATDPLAKCPPTPNTTYCGIGVADISNTKIATAVPLVYVGQPTPTTTTTAPGQTTTTAPAAGGGTTTTTAATGGGTTTTTAAATVQGTTATSSTLPVTGSSRRLLGLAVLGAGFVVVGFALTAGGRRARRRSFRP